MDTGLKRPHRRATIELWRIIVLVAGAFSFALLAIGRVPSQEVHEAILTSLRAVDVNHASLQRDVLQARGRLLANYDPLVDSIVNLHGAVSRLKELFTESDVETAVELNHELSALAVSIDDDEELVERFKTDNALLQNSLSLSNHLLTDLHASDDPAVVRALGTSADLGNLMMGFAADPDEHLSQVIHKHLDDMTRSDQETPAEIRSYADHAATVLNTLPLVNRTIAAIEASGTSLEAQALERNYLDSYGVVSTRSAWIRRLLGSISVFLCLSTAVLVYRLRAQTHRLAQQLDFEDLAAEVRKRFNENFESTGTALSESLDMIAQFFNVNLCAFIIMDSETKGVVETYGSSDGKRLEEFIHLFSSHIPALMREEQLQGDRFYYHNLKHRGIQSLPQGAMSAGAVVVASIDTRLLGLLFLEYDELRKKADRDEVRLLGRAVAILVQNIKALRQREQKEDLEIRLEHSQRLEAVGTLAGGIAHEFNNALGAILGYGEMALQVSRNSARTRQYVREIVSSGERAKRIVDQILTFSRKRERIAKPFDVKEALEDIMPLVGLAVPGGEISMHIADGLPAVSGNPIELQQVIMNLCTNSAQAMGETGQIEIDVREVDIGVKQVLSHGLLPRGKYVHISVQDHGSGIAPSVLPHIFEPFFTTRAKSGGTGLGLSAVHGLVTAMKGNINVYSDANNGTRFDIYLPSTCQPPVPLRQFFNEQIIPLGDGQMVVIGQRDTGLRLMFEEKIAALGYEPIGFSSISALEGWLDENERPPELVLLDVDLWTSAPELKEINRQFGSIQTLIMADADHVEDHKSEERTSFLRKPVSSNSLAAGIFKAIVRP